jgi:hypothetical protein
MSPVESCGATLSEVDLVLRDMALVMAMEAAANESEQNAGDEAAEDDFATNKDLPEWKQRCIKNYVNCRDGGWTGNCYDCLRRCEGQHEWPIAMCGPRGSKKR